MTYYRETFKAGNHEFPVMVRRDNPDPASRMWEKARDIRDHKYPTSPPPRRLLKPHEHVKGMPTPPTSIDWTNRK
jgi:hypothetical protein